MKILQYVFLILTLLNEYGHSQVNIRLEMRPRSELRAGYSQLLLTDQSPVLTTSQRSRLTMLYKAENMDVNMSFQDVRVWGDEKLISSTGVFGDPSSIDLNEAWIDLRVHENFSIKIGRQYLVYDDERLLSQRNWNQSSLKYDALLLQYSNSTMEIDAAFALNNEEDRHSYINYPAEKNKSMNLLHCKFKISDELDLSALSLLNSRSSADSSGILYAMETFGLYSEYSTGVFSLNSSAYLQSGKDNTGKDVLAYLISAESDLSFESWNLVLGGILISGNNYSKNYSKYESQNNSFDLIYGARHKYYGRMDYFSNLPKSTNNSGLIDLNSSLSTSPLTHLKLQLDIHYFLNQTKSVVEQNQRQLLSRYLGLELDFLLNIKFNSDVKLDGGYSILSPSETLKIFQVAQEVSSPSHWVWLMLSASVDFQINI